MKRNQKLGLFFIIGGIITIVFMILSISCRKNLPLQPIEEYPYCHTHYQIQLSVNFIIAKRVANEKNSRV